MTHTPFNEALRRAAAARRAAPEVSDADADAALMAFVDAALIAEAEASGAADGAAGAARPASVLDECAAFESLENPSTLKGGLGCGTALISNGNYETAPLSSETPKTGRRSRHARTPDALQAVLDAFKFDWFQFVIPNTRGGGECVVGGPEESNGIGRAMRFLEGHGLRAGEPGSGGRGYATALPFFDGSGVERVATVASGSHAGGMPNLTLTGGRGLCHNLAPLAQAAFPGLRLTRADAALDVVAPGAFEALLNLSRRFAKGRGMTAPTVRGTETPEAGLTFYVGSRTSETLLRVYQKGLQLNAEARRSNPSAPAVADPDWVRIEFQFSGIPGRKKVGLGALTPGEMVAAYTWPRLWLGVAAAEIGMTDAMERAARVVVKQEERMRDINDTLNWGAKQYGKAFSRAAILELKRERGDGGDAEITHDAVVDRASELFRRALIGTDKTERVMRVDLLGDGLTDDERVALHADRQQAIHAGAVGAHERALRRLALAVAAATRHEDTAAMVGAAAERAAERRDALHADRLAIEAEWATRKAVEEEAARAAPSARAA